MIYGLCKYADLYILSMKSRRKFMNSIFDIYTLYMPQYDAANTISPTLGIFFKTALVQISK